MKQAVLIDGLSKRYGEVTALDNIELSVETGELFGLIGPDGAGKTTLLRVLTTLIKPDTGRATVAGFDCVSDYRRIRQIVGYMPGRFSLYQDLSIEENLEFFATVFGTTIEQNYDLIRDIYVQIEPFKDRRAGQLSGGMKQKLALCCALIHRPEVLILDEPTTGVDAVSRDEFWVMLGRIRQEGITTVVSTPYMDEASRCDRIALMQEGRFVGLGPPKEVAARFPDPLFEVKARDRYALVGLLRNLDFTHQAVLFGDSIHLSTKLPVASDAIQAELDRLGHQAVVRRIEPTVEDAFMEIVSRP